MVSTKLFKAFSQVDSSTTRQYGGTGLGLVISERLIHLMKGKISVESEVGKGTTFSFTIIAEPARSKNAREQADAVFLPGKKLLLIDDNFTNRSNMKLMLEEWGLCVKTAASGKETLDIVKAGNSFDLVMSDYGMPGIDGSALIKELNKISFRSPIILMASASDGRFKRHEQVSGTILSKPIKPAQVYKLLQQYLENDIKSLKSSVKSSGILDERFAAENPLRILLAEDNLINQKLAVRILNKLGYHPDVANDGVEALEMLPKKEYDLILMDVLMPNLDGLETTKKIRREGKYRPKIVAMTANAYPEDKEACLAAGMDGYLSKPIQMESFIAALKEMSRINNTKLFKQY
ncbi:response regulator [Desertivirga brevis]|uniref:response regulator n=1 Tax=Desertivirga brevis TaxID=2810310 RepID=UPI001F62347B|nr:response regulator [Pedobacter sp. SYSU D00873]